MIALSSKEKFEYTPLRDRKSDEPSVFILKALSIAETEECENLLSPGMAGKGIQMGSYHTRLIKVGLIGWKNVKSEETGKDLPFELDGDGRVTDKILSMFDDDLRSELKNAIQGRGNVSEADEKNSS